LSQSNKEIQDLTKTTDILIILVCVLITLIDLNMFGLDIIFLFIVYLIFLIWAAILTFNLSNIALEYAFPDEIYVISGQRSRRVIRAIVLVVAVGLLLILTVLLVNQISEAIGLAVAINILALRVAFLVLSPEENPYFFINPHKYS